MSEYPTSVDPTEVGLDAARLERLDQHLQRFIDDGRLAGWSIAVTRHGELAHLTHAGRRDLEADLPVTDDTIWRIYSMTKPLTAVVAMMMWERGLFELNDPVDRYLPAFRDTRVWRSGSTTNPVTEPITETLRVWHLFAHCSGITYGFMQAHPVDALYRQAGMEWGTPPGLDLEGVTDLVASLPLLFQPGTEWNYGMSIDVLGRLVEVVTGETFDVVLQREVLDPLGMDDTVWTVDETRAERLAALYIRNPGGGTALRFDQMGRGALERRPCLEPGGGLSSTMADYLRFADMLLNGGERDGVRLLAPRTVEMMSRNVLPGGADLTAFGRPLFSETTFDGVGFGLGMSVTIDPATSMVAGSPGDFGWGGAASTSFLVDPVEDLTMVFLTQLLPSSTYPLRSQIRQLLYSSIID